MENEFLAIIERDGEWHIAYCPEIPGPTVKANPRTKPAKTWLRPFALILEGRREEGLRGVPPEAFRETVAGS